MAWRRTGDKPLAEPMLVSFTDAHMRHLATYPSILLLQKALFYTDVITNPCLILDDGSANPCQQKRPLDLYDHVAESY